MGNEKFLEKHSEEYRHNKKREYMRPIMREWSRKNKDKIHGYHLRRKMQVLFHYGGNLPKCACCSESHVEFLTLDHIKGDGAEHRRQITGDPRKCSGHHIYAWIIKNNFPEGFQVLCCNCNMAKGRSKVRFCPVHHPELYSKPQP
jgi:hypothetical protein